MPYSVSPNTMKGKQVWANEWRDKYSEPGEFEESGQQEAWMAGFHCARSRAAGLIEAFNNPKLVGVPFLIRSIGEGKVDARDDGQI